MEMNKERIQVAMDKITDIVNSEKFTHIELCAVMGGASGNLIVQSCQFAGTSMLKSIFLDFFESQFLAISAQKAES